MENGSFEKHINRLRNYYQTKRDAILQVFQKEPLGKYVTIREEGAGVHFLMQIHTEKSEEEIVTEAKEKASNWHRCPTILMVKKMGILKTRT